MGKITSFLFIGVSALFINAQSLNIVKKQNCKANLKVEKNRNVKSVSPLSKVNYYLTLTNTSNTKATYAISISEPQKQCSKANKRAVIEDNIPLNFTIESNNDDSFKKSNNYITLSPKQSYNFKVKVRVFKDTPIEKWNCSEVKITSVECNEVVASTVLKTFVLNPALR